MKRRRVLTWHCSQLSVLYIYSLGMGTGLEQVITKLLYLINQGETFTKVWILSTLLLFRFLVTGSGLPRSCGATEERVM
jgi:hypothetical protein